MTHIDRRTFLKGLLGVAAVAVVAPQALAKPIPKLTSNCGCGQCPPGTYSHRKPLVVEPLPEVKVEGIIHIDGVHVLPGDTVYIDVQADPKNQGIYRVQAVAKDGSGEVTIARVHKGDEVTMPMDKLESYLNREIRGYSMGIDYAPGRDKVAVTHGHVRPRKTWPTPRRRRR